MSSKVADSFVNEETALFLRRNDVVNQWGKIVSSFQTLPGLVGFWPMSSVQRSTGNAFDLSGQARTLTFNGNPTYNIYNGIMPYIDLDGTGDFLSRADETDLDILGTEAIYAAAVRGLTLGGWYWVDTLGGVSRGLISKSLATGNQRSYLLFISVTNTISFQISNNGTAVNINDSGFVPSIVDTPRWYFIVARLVPSTSQDIFINGTWYRYSTTIPASIFNSTAQLEVGSFNGGTAVFDGRASLNFLSANALSDAVIFSLYEQSRVLFGV